MNRYDAHANAHICYRLGDHTVRGVYLHYRGYPKNIIPILHDMRYQQVVDVVERGLREDGLYTLCPMVTFDQRTHHPRKRDPEQSQWLVKSFPPKTMLDYAYIKNFDGSLSWCACRNIQHHLEPMIHRIEFPLNGPIIIHR